MKCKILSILTAACVLVACEKPYVGMEPETFIDEDANVIVRVVGFETIDFDDPASTRASVNITELCSRLNVVVYKDDTKVSSIAQKKADDNFGTIGLSLQPGTYKLAVIGHNSDGTATVTTLDKISFKNNRVTDTFCYYSEVEVTGEKQELDVELRRVVAMFRLCLTDPLPVEVQQLKFYYTGGSSTLSAVTGYGSVNSKQTVVLDVESGQQRFEVYTIPHEETDTLKMTITALGAGGTELHQHVFEDVPVQRDKITRYSGSIYADNTNETGGGLSVHMHGDGEWEGEDEVEF